MRDGLRPAERYDGTMSVVVLGEDGTRGRYGVHSYEAAISTVRDCAGPRTVCKIEDREGRVVFTSEEMDIDDWANEWRRAHRRFTVDVEEHECPYDTVGCIADDRCVQCQMDRQQQRVRE